MMQRVFDIENAKDMADLWDILPDDATAITKGKAWDCLFLDDDFNHSIRSFLSINWHDKTEIHRPIKEATEADVGKLCVFWDNEYNPNAKIVGCLCTILPFNNFKYTARGGLNYRHCRRLTKQEIEELC